MALQPIRPRKRFPNADAYIASKIGLFVWALSGNFFGVIRKGRREGRRIILTLESSDGRDVDVWADECSTNKHAAQMMRMAAAIPRAVKMDFHQGLENK